MGRHFVRALIVMCVLSLVTAAACVVKTGPSRRGSYVTEGKHKKAKKHKKHKKHHRKHARKHRKHRHR